MNKIHNFSAGPAILPQEVFKKSAEAILNFNDSGLSILEISHRSKDFEAVMQKSVDLVKKLLNLPQGYSVIFVQGGASTQFAMVPLNLLSLQGTAAYTNTGVWATAAIKEAKMMGNVNVLASSEEKNFNFVPQNYEIPKDADYFHCTSNNTIYGTRMHSFPDSPVPMVCDMSSDMFSRTIDASKFGLIYAGAQKNMGPAGVTMVVVKDEILGKSGRNIPTMLNYQTHIKGGSMYNTPPVFAVYVMMLTLEWLDNFGGTDAIEVRNNAKAALLYNEIERNGLFSAVVPNPTDRSIMNPTFVLHDPSQETAFMALATQANISGIKGHRSVGGFRASMYNAMDLDSVQALVEIMQAFEKSHG